MQTSARRVVDAARNNVPEGTWAVGGGLLVAALGGWIFQVMAEKHLSDVGYNAVNSLWILTFVVTPGFFQPLEQEVARAIAHRRAHGEGGGPVLWKAVKLGIAVAAIITVVALCVFTFMPSTVDQLFKKGLPGGDHAILIASFLIALLTYAAAYLARGALSGNGRFKNYGIMHGSEGAVRIVAVVAIVLFTTSTTTEHGRVHEYASNGAFGLALVLPPIVAVVLALRGQKGLAEPGPDASYSELSNALAWLLASSVMAQALSYAPVFAAEILVGPGAKDQKQLAGFVTAMFLARVPLLLFQAVQAALLPKLAASAAAGKHDEFRAGLQRLLVLVAGIAILGVLGALTVGRPVGKIIFHNKWTLSNGDLALLAAGAGAYIVAFTLAQGLIALKAYSKITLGWFVGVFGFVVMMPIGSDVFTRAQVAFLVSSVLSAAVITVLLFRTLRTTTASFEDLVDAITHEPLEY